MATEPNKRIRCRPYSGTSYKKFYNYQHQRYILWGIIVKVDMFDKLMIVILVPVSIVFTVGMALSIKNDYDKAAEIEVIRLHCHNIDKFYSDSLGRCVTQ